MHQHENPVPNLKIIYVLGRNLNKWVHLKQVDVPNHTAYDTGQILKPWC